MKTLLLALFGFVVFALGPAVALRGIGLALAISLVIEDLLLLSQHTHVPQHVSGGIMWANLHLLFWLSLIPFVTGWMGENHFAALPCALYGFVLFMAAIAYFAMQAAIIHLARQGKIVTDGEPGPDSEYRLA